METNSTEYTVLVRHTADLQLSIKFHLTTLGAECVSKQLITPDQYSEVRNSHQEVVDRAAKMVELLQNKVQRNAQCYHTFTAILEKHLTEYGDILPKLQATYQSVLQQPSSKSTSTSSGPGYKSSK